jgi:hypothetical protein
MVFECQKKIKGNENEKSALSIKKFNPAKGL